MKSTVGIVLLLSSIPLLAQQQADEIYADAAMEHARAMLGQHHGGQTRFMILGDILEYQHHDGDAKLHWEGRGWFGTDLHKFMLKTEGHYNLDEHDPGKRTEASVAALYNRAVSPYWDVQLGLRHADSTNSSRNYAVLGIEGLSPYWLEIDAAAYLSERGDLSLEIAGEYDMHLTQRLILQPKFEMVHAFSSDPDTLSSQGVNNLSLAVRMRYEIKRELAPYLGISWGRTYGRTEALLQQAGSGNENLSLVAGIRFWY